MCSCMLGLVLIRDKKHGLVDRFNEVVAEVVRLFGVRGVATTLRVEAQFLRPDCLSRGAQAIE